MNFCPFCEDNDIVTEHISRVETWECRELKFDITNEFYRCSKCGEEWYILDGSLNDPYEELYSKYEQETGIDPRYKGDKND
jgi:hypothetical protein